MNENADRLIAIVDDDVSVREATASLLRSNGFRTESFATAEAFLTSRLPAIAACLLLDVAMPGMTGLELQRRLIAEGRRIPIIFITAHDSQDARREAMRWGAVEFLPKPFGEEALLRAIHRAFQIPPDKERTLP
jgi:FixJ family two-component response regulator